MEFKSRRHPTRQPLHNVGRRSRIVYVTVCSDKRRPILATPEVHQRLLAAWSAADHWKVGRYVLMPDDLHLFCSPGKPDFLNVKKWVAYWKSLASQKWPNPDEQPVWQVDSWDVQLRTGERYSEKWEYTRLNPVRAGLVQSPDDWPFQGELNTLFW